MLPGDIIPSHEYFPTSGDQIAKFADGLPMCPLFAIVSASQTEESGNDACFHRNPHQWA